jgi:hypothetical protein
MARPVNLDLSPLCLRTLQPRALLAWPAQLRRRPEVRAFTYALLGAHQALGLISAEERAVARGMYLQALAHNRRQLRRLDEIVRAAQAIDLPLVPLKGALLARAYYGDPGARPMVDLDLACRPRDLARATALLEGLGLRARAHPRWRVRHDAVHDRQFVDGAVLVELHFKRWHELGLASDIDPLMDRASDGAPAPCDHLYFVLLHAATHGFAGNALWRVDALLLATAHPELWPAVWQLGARERTTVALTAAIDQLALAFPEARLPRWPTPAPLRRRLLRRVAPRLGGDRELGSFGSRLVRALLWQDGRALGPWAARKATLWWHAFTHGLGG